MTPRIGGLCFGYGGLDMAVQEVLGGELAWVSDIDPGPLKIIAHRHPTITNLGDLTAVDWDTVHPIDILTAGYPCQPFSGNGTRKGTTDVRHLWPHILRAIRRLRPSLVILENVEDHLTLGFDRVLADLAEARFDAEWCVLRASDVGAAHGRPRLFIIAADAGSVLHAPTQPDVLVGSVRSEPAPPGPERLPGASVGHDEDQVRPDQDGSRSTDWGDYGPAVERWTGIVGRPAPVPLIARAGDPDINPRFVEWLMGLPDGWVTDVPGITTSEALKALGNGVVPQQAAAALRFLLSVHERGTP